MTFELLRCPSHIAEEMEQVTLVKQMARKLYSFD